ncbi:ECF transporter S component [Clostridium botulinum]|uniref:ECF transporter S component n=1 Tax=Clostridium TaxID=1485 RepID=UPI0005F96E24|nr:ECF transporter S component [Clostridium botulinum]MBO0526213.1 ECF transporter S component [Clostridium botulinum]MBO0527926.1 ECF transporter S component [Clostridium botulinum]MBO0531133.1 ECF transporter S component [Clostridium botulinum]MBO0534718.1 ECF transporter S component [Clostridium botulinum]MBO0538066.1 ECF transporter S component [Clostridium botulinum]
MVQSKNKQLVRGALLIAIGLLLPYLFHGIKNAGSIFLPMHIPILIGGFILSPYFALAVGVLTPLLSHLFTGMPPFPFVYVMVVELLTYGVVISILYNKKKIGIYPSLIIGMLSGRLANILCNYLVLHLIMTKPFKFSVVLAGLFVKGLPGIIIQLILIPILVKALGKVELGKAV